MNFRNESQENFCKQIKKKTVFCFGTGVLLDNLHFCEFWEKWFKDAAEIIFLDNDESKWASDFTYRSEKYSVCPPDKLLEYQNEKVILLLTVSFRHCLEIVPQLNRMNEFANIDCYFFESMLRMDDENLVQAVFSKEIYKPEIIQYRTRLEQLHLKNRHAGKRCFVLGNGPSLRMSDLEKLTGEITFSSNYIYKAFEKTSWRPTYYVSSDVSPSMDLQLFEHLNQESGTQLFFPTDTLLVFGRTLNNVFYYNKLSLPIQFNACGEYSYKEYLFSDNIVNGVYAGCCVTCQLLQFAAYMGFSEIYLLGVDHSWPDGVKAGVYSHFYGTERGNFEKFKKYEQSDFMFNGGYESAKQFAHNHGFHIYDATRGGRLEVFERVDFDQIIS